MNLKIDQVDKLKFILWLRGPVKFHMQDPVRFHPLLNRNVTFHSLGGGSKYYWSVLFPFTFHLIKAALFIDGHHLIGEQPERVKESTTWEEKCLPTF